MVRGIIVSAALALILPAGGASAGEWTVGLSGPPGDLTFPLAEGANAILTATVEGGDAKAVWLAPRADAKVRYLLSPAGGGRFRLPENPPGGCRIPSGWMGRWRNAPLSAEDRHCPLRPLPA